MSVSGPVSELVAAVESVMLEQFQTVPFHNLHLLYGPDFHPSVPGGTCSDKTLSFIAAGVARGFDVSLHSACIGGQEIHRLARVEIERRQFFADVGNGWPSLRLYPADQEITYRCFGMGFRTEISDGRISVWHENQGVETLQLEIGVHGRPEAEIRADIERRFCSGVVYPFSTSLRFSQVIGQRFLFLRGNRLEIYDDAGFECLTEIEHSRVPDVLREYFHHQVQGWPPPSER